MKCPFCANEEDKVLESREIDEGQAVRRRRQCLKCEGRFTSYERIEERPLMVIKRDGSRQPFSRQKLMAGLLRACEKRPISMDQIDEMVDEVERTVHRESGREVKTSRIGELIMEKLQKIDQVAYVRFASVYRQFSDVSEFVREIKELAPTEK